jgi:hypothetical protein
MAPATRSRPSTIPRRSSRWRRSCTSGRDSRKSRSFYRARKRALRALFHLKRSPGSFGSARSGFERERPRKLRRTVPFEGALLGLCSLGPRRTPAQSGAGPRETAPLVICTIVRLVRLMHSSLRERLR